MPIEKLFSELTASPSAKGALSGAASGAMVSLLMNKKARKKIGSSAATVGGMAALAGVGYLAYKKFSGNRAGTTTEPAAVEQAVATRKREQMHEAVPAVSDRLGILMIKAMIAASNADGTIDPKEMDALFLAMENANLSPEENRELTQALNNPPTLESISAEVDNPEAGAEVYGAALSAIDPDTASEQLFLRRFAAALHLEPGLVECIHAESLGEKA